VVPVVVVMAVVPVLVSFPKKKEELVSTSAYLLCLLG